MPPDFDEIVATLCASWLENSSTPSFSLIDTAIPYWRKTLLGIKQIMRRAHSGARGLEADSKAGPLLGADGTKRFDPAVDYDFTAIRDFVNPANRSLMTAESGKYRRISVFDKSSTSMARVTWAAFPSGGSESW